MSRLFEFGEKVKDYDVNVLNEREARAGAGILFLFAMISFMNAWLIGDYSIIKVFVTVFFVDFFIRVLINPKYAPTLILGRIFVSNQKPEYTGAPQKKFAWSLGLGLAAIMFFLVVINDVRGLLNFFICIFCLVLLFFESVFGVCIGCKMYGLITRKKAKLCPGGACEINRKQEIQKVRISQVIILVVSIAIIITSVMKFII